MMESSTENIMDQYDMFPMGSYVEYLVARFGNVGTLGVRDG